MATDYAKRIAALLAKAEGTDNKAEAEAFTAKAAELMMRHGIDKAQLRTEQGRRPEEVTTLEVDLPADHGTVLIEALTPMVKAMGGEAIRIDGVYTLVGTVSLLENLETLITCMEMQMVTLSNAEGDRWVTELRKAHPSWTEDQLGDEVDGKVWDFVRGFGQGVGEKIRSRRRNLSDEAPGNALALQSEADRIRAAYNAMFPNRGVLRGQRVSDPNAMARGRAAGRNADIGDGRVGGGTRAIG